LAAVTDFQDRVVFVTGASSGIGAAVARRFAKDGAKLVLLARRRDRLEALAAEVKVPCHVLAVDVADREAVTRAIAGLPSAFADVALLVSSAGGALGLGKAQEASLDDWDRMIDANVKGLVYVTRALLPGMVRRDRGHIVNLGSVAGTYPYPGGNVYGATKAFVRQLSLNLRADLLGTRVRVTDIQPGMVETEFSLVRFKGDAEKAAATYRGMKPLTADDVADVVHYCASVPEHVNIDTLELMSVDQAFGGFAVHRTP
jgi:NADP-dependent 3-hydroxy acid dehydrogenase YdfG